jgi:hypothetical protein
MTELEAAARAVEVFGSGGAVLKGLVFAVGVRPFLDIEVDGVLLRGEFEARGFGSSWEAAFENANRRNRNDATRQTAAKEETTT